MTIYTVLDNYLTFVPSQIGLHVIVKLTQKQRIEHKNNPIC